MTQQKLIASIEQYQPYNVQEEMDKSLILEWIKNNNNAFLRENTVAHMTASAFIETASSESASNKYVTLKCR